MTTEKISLKKLNLKKEEDDKISFFELLNHSYNEEKKPEEFTRKMLKRDIQKLVAMIDVNLDNKQIDEVWKRSINNVMSLNEFMIECKNLGYVK